MRRCRSEAVARRLSRFARPRLIDTELWHPWSRCRWPPPVERPAAARARCSARRWCCGATQPDACSAWADRCPHRGAQLSLGRVRRRTRSNARTTAGVSTAAGSACTCRRCPISCRRRPPRRRLARRARRMAWCGWRAQARRRRRAVPASAAAERRAGAPSRVRALRRRRPARRAWSRTSSTSRISASCTKAGWARASMPDVPDYRVASDAPAGLASTHCRAWQPRASAAAGAGSWVDYRYEVLRPFSRAARQARRRRDAGARPIALFDLSARHAALPRVVHDRQRQRHARATTPARVPGHDVRAGPAGARVAAAARDCRWPAANCTAPPTG